MKVSFISFHELTEYGGLDNGIRNTILAAKEVGIDVSLDIISNKKDLDNIDADIFHFSNFIEFAQRIGSYDRHCVLHLHGYFPECHPKIDHIPEERNIHPDIERVLYNNTVIYSGYKFANFIDSENKYGGHVLWNCIDPSIFYPKKYKKSGLFSTINLTYMKGIDRLDCEIDVAGERISDIGNTIVFIPPYVNVIGKLTQQEVSEKLNKSEIFIHPSRLESCSIAIIEALATGTPVIASNVGDNGYMIQGAGIILDEWNEYAIQYAIDLIESHYSTFTYCALEQAEKFTPFQIGRRLLQIYLEI